MTKEEQWKDIILSRFYYKDGNIYLKSRPNQGYFNVNYANKVVGYECGGYLRCTQVSVLGKRKFSVHRIVWLLNTGEWPKHTIDHINRDKLDNRFENLRDVTQSSNNANKGVYKKGGFKFRGVYPNGRKWRVQISHNKKKISLGSYHCIGEAVRVYEEAAKRLRG